MSIRSTLIGVGACVLSVLLSRGLMGLRGGAAAFEIGVLLLLSLALGTAAAIASERLLATKRR
jgi:hypothetical protein